LLYNFPVSPFCIPPPSPPTQHVALAMNAHVLHLPIPTRRLLTRRDCLSGSCANMKLLSVVYEAQRLKDMLPRLLQWPCFHVVLFCADGEVAVGADGQVAAAAINIKGLGGNRPKPTLSTKFGKLFDVLQESDSECLTAPATSNTLFALCISTAYASSAAV